VAGGKGHGYIVRMPGLKQWQRGPIVTLIVAWIACTGATLTIFFLAQARSAERTMLEMGFRLGPGAAAPQIDWLGALPRIVGYYIVIVLLPPFVLWLLWWRARSA
jgi:hypothetical protein